MYIYTEEDEGVRKSHIVVLEDWVVCTLGISESNRAFNG